MNTLLPFFNYTPELYGEVLQAGILFSEHSILRLMCFKEKTISEEQQSAIRNFEYWVDAFIHNSNTAFYTASDADVNLFSIDYSNLLLSCLLTATFYDYKVYANLNSLNTGAFVLWHEGRLVKDRPMSQLL